MEKAQTLKDQKSQIKIWKS